MCRGMVRCRCPSARAVQGQMTCNCHVNLRHFWSPAPAKPRHTPTPPATHITQDYWERLILTGVSWDFKPCVTFSPHTIARHRILISETLLQVHEYWKLLASYKFVWLTPKVFALGKLLLDQLLEQTLKTPDL